jgi:NlpC/P60 family putative phage cell wall peptidase
MSVMAMTDHRHRIVAAARSWLGTPYVHQASCKGAGCDCLGLIRGVWRELYGTEPESPPPYTPDWAERHGRETLLAAAARDVLLFRYRPHLPAKHAGIATGPDTMIHAQEKAGVVEVPLSGWWRRHLVAVFAFPPAR